MNRSALVTYSAVALLLGASVVVAACSDDDAATPATAPTGVDAAGVDATSATDGGSEASVKDAAISDAPVEASGSAIGMGPYALAYAGTIVGIDSRAVAAGKATFSASKMTSYESSADERPTVGTNTVNDVAGSARFAIGRWSAGTTGGKFYLAGDAGLIDFPANGGFHYAIGIPANPVPSSGMTAYTMLAKTSATVSDGSFAVGTVTGTLAAKLAGATTKLGFSVTLDVPGDTAYTVSSVGGTADPSQAGTGMLAHPGGFFDNTTTVTTTGALCPGGGGCTGTVHAIVVGPAAENIALVVRVYRSAAGEAKSVSGVIVFEK